jgi:hypothetical protein
MQTARSAHTQPAVAFLPWIRVERPLKIGTLRLIPERNTILGQSRQPSRKNS